MIYSQIPPKPETLRRRLRAAVLMAALALTGCSTYNPVTLFHRYEGGVIGTEPPPAPGLDAPWPNLASVPKRPPMLPSEEQASVRRRLEAANRTQNRLGGQGLPVTKPVPAPQRQEAPVRVGFRPGAAVLSHADLGALRALAARRGDYRIAAIGFAPTRDAAGIRLALLRATAIANALTAAGVPGAAIRIEALATGRGGAAQMLYGEKSHTEPTSQDQS